ncbi:CRISPR-associated endonuclease Cas2 [Sinanaerobacter sp. ZZT-01]|uniref:CRISPR-associated endonuclease Cas2 n=1 Tax=Sinanaerobacter sp. ZZT-01 TaxID=3111540 RepID=UPI002D775FDD|nr:CRISPR-associated endonuclease Cas2 [Sinanaerobacter sp. ZZT-01]WRR92486.1 CRISPR-associated endonuclease Cas2 [Sinanaerobacter sp. ZZT-01]
MFVLITYDVNTQDAAGKTRLRKVAKQCVNYGQRVQNSVFECVIDPAKMKALQYKLESIIDPEKDSLRFYYLGKNYKEKIEHVGAKPSYDVEGVLML